MATPTVVRATRQRTAIAELLGGLSDFRSAQDIHHQLRSQGDGIGLSTVYRKCSGVHHHHLVCRGCGHTVEVAGPAVEQWADRMADDHGFSDVSHTLEIFGTCAQCRGEG